MKVDYTGRGFDITESIKEHTENKLGRILKGVDLVGNVQVILIVEKFRHIAEIIVRTKSKTFAIKEETEDMYSAVHMSIDKLERNIRKHKEKIVDARRKGRRDKEFSMDMMEAEPEELETDRPKIIKTDEITVKPMSVEEAALQLSTADDNFIVFRNAGSEIVNVIYKRKDGNYGLIEPDAR